jgi:hypothetical protein
MKYLIWFLFISAIVSIFLGISIPDSDTIDSAIKAQEIAVSEKLIGFGVLGLFFVVFPLSNTKLPNFVFERLIIV